MLIDVPSRCHVSLCSPYKSAVRRHQYLFSRIRPKRHSYSYCPPLCSPGCPVQKQKYSAFLPLSQTRPSKLKLLPMCAATSCLTTRIAYTPSSPTLPAYSMCQLPSIYSLLRSSSLGMK